MPKTFAQYNRYDSGINLKSNDEDIDPASLAECDGWDVNNPGEISTIAHSTTITNAKFNIALSLDSVFDGSMFKLVRSDFTYASEYGVSPTSITATEAATGNTMAFYGNAVGTGMITDIEGTPAIRNTLNSSLTYHTSFATPASASLPAFLWHEGELRISDKLNDANSVLRWMGILNRTRFEGSNDTYNVIASKWAIEELSILPPKLPASNNNAGNGVVYLDYTGSTTSKLPDLEAGMPNLLIKQTASEEDGTWESTEYEFGMSYVYKGNQESTVTVMIMKKWNTSNNAFDTVTSYLLNKRQYWTLANMSVKNASATDFPLRQTGCRIYLRKHGSGKRWRLLMDSDFERGVRANTFDRFDSGWSRNNTGLYYMDTSMSFKNASIETYEGLTGVLNDERSVSFNSDVINTDGIKGTGWSLAKAVGRRIFYIGCKYYTENSNEKLKLHDRVFYSQGAKPDIVPTGNWIDLGINDGDAFIAVESFAGRLCLFKRNKIYILNVQNPSPMGWGMEQEIDNNGVLSPANVLLTRFGIVWANKYGCFIYSGQGVPVELSAQIGAYEWESYLDQSSDNYSLGMDSKTNQLFVMQSGGTSVSVTTNMWVYNFATKGWSRRKDSAKLANNGFFNDISGQLYYMANNHTTNYITGYKVQTTPMKGDVALGTVTSCPITDAGSGYTFATVSFSGGGGSGAAATALAVLGSVVSCTVTNSGSGYTSAPTVTINGNGIDAAATASVAIITTTKTFTLKDDNFGSPGIMKRFYNVKVDVKNENNAILKVKGNGTPIASKNLSANTDFVTKIYTFSPVVESDTMQLSFESTGEGGVTIGNVVLEYRTKRLRIESDEGN